MLIWILADGVGPYGSRATVCDRPRQGLRQLDTFAQERRGIHQVLGLG